MIKSYTIEDLPGIHLRQENSGVPRATRPAGFSVSECWGGFLPKDVDHADHMFGLIDAVRIMIKFDEWQNNPQMVARMIATAQKARSLGKKVHLCIDIFNTATGPDDYHSHTLIPSMHKMAGMIRDIIEAFPTLWKVEVFNEPYHCKNHSQRITILKYVEYVKKFVEGLSMTTFSGKLVASQTSKEFWTWRHPENKIENGWEWVTDTVWHRGNLEGKHSAVLHTETTSAGLIDKISGTWHQDKAIGWRHPIDETECSPVGKHISTNSHHGKVMTRAILDFMKVSKCPITILTWGAKYDGFGHPDWPGEMHYVNKHGVFAEGAQAFYEFYGVEMPSNGEEPPVDHNWDRQIEAAGRDLGRALRRGKTIKGIRSARRAIEHCENAIG